MRAERLTLLRAQISTSEVSTWPTCIVCTDASFAGGPGFERWVPVEEYSIEPEVFRNVPLVGTVEGGLPGPRTIVVPDVLNPSRMLKTRGWFTVVGKCSHGRAHFVDEQKAEIDVPYWWGAAHVRARIASLEFFGAAGKLAGGELRRVS